MGLVEGLRTVFGGMVFLQKLELATYPDRNFLRSVLGVVLFADPSRSVLSYVSR
jgi:hypothetical protein